MSDRRDHYQGLEDSLVGVELLLQALHIFVSYGWVDEEGLDSKKCEAIREIVRLGQKSIETARDHYGEVLSDQTWWPAGALLGGVAHV